MGVGGAGIGPRQEFINIIAGACMTAIVLPIVGFVLGAILVARQREGHGIWGDGCINAHGYFLAAGSLGDRERAVSKRASN